MVGESMTLGDVCGTRLLATKWLLAPSHRVGHQWVEGLVRAGQPVVNLRPTTVLRLALDFVGSELAEEGLTLVGRSVGALLVDASWPELASDGYLGRLGQSAGLSASVYESLLALRLAGCSAETIEAGHFETAAKAVDVDCLLTAYQGLLSDNRLVDEADVLRRAIAKLGVDPSVADRGAVVGSDTLVLLPADLQLTGLEKEFVGALPEAIRVAVEHPVGSAVSATPPPGAAATGPSTDICLLRGIGKVEAKREPANDGSVQMFRAVGEVNEVREVLRRVVARGLPLDDVEILHTDREMYVPLIDGIAQRHAVAGERKGGVPVTFADGISASLSRPGRALMGWLHWIEQGYPQRLLVELIADGLLDCGEDKEVSFSYLAKLFRPIAIGIGADNYLPKLDEQIKATEARPPAQTEDEGETARILAAHNRKLKALKAIRKLAKRLLDLAKEIGSTSSAATLQAAEKFLRTMARSVNELDRNAVNAIAERIEDRRVWLDRLGTSLNLRKWLAALPEQTRVLASGPKPGHVHVAGIGNGGHSGRRNTFVIGLDDRRFPGATLQDPILLDRERERLSPELSTSAVRLRRRIEDLSGMLPRLSGAVTLSWPCQSLADDREIFPSSVVLSAHRLVSGKEDADLDALNSSVGPPVSFAPNAADKALDETERWLWRLSEDELQCADQTKLIEPSYSHLARGSAAAAQRFGDFGSFNGYVPRAGEDLSPFAEDGLVLSASNLETAGRCPLAFFFQKGLRLYVPDELEIDPDRWLDAAQFGSLLHDVFRRFMSECSEAGHRPEFDRDHQRLAAILQEAIDQWRLDVPPPNENAFRMQSWQLVRTASIFLQSEEVFCNTSQPRFFEVSLGLQSEGDGTALDSMEPASVQLPNGQALRVRGRIDRVDEADAGTYTVWDYKTGSAYGYEENDPFKAGRRVQSVLYLQMSEAALRASLDPKAIVEQFGYFFPSTKAQGLRIDWDASTLSAGLPIVQRLCESIEEGAFVATHEEDDCKFCDYRAVCRDFKRVTDHTKSLLRQADLVPLTHFRGLRGG